MTPSRKTENLSELIDRVRYARDDWSLDRLAELCGMNRTHLSLVRLGQRTCTELSVQKLARGLAVDAKIVRAAAERTALETMGAVS
jgi:hypothetical protein